jgi:hypothetical protein
MADDGGQTHADQRRECCLRPKFSIAIEKQLGSERTSSFLPYLGSLPPYSFMVYTFKPAYPVGIQELQDYDAARGYVGHIPLL